MPFKAYFDASGKDEDPVLTVGGYIATDNACESIESLWKNATNDKTFHLADFGRPQCKLGSGDWTAHERCAFLKKLGAIIASHETRIISLSVETAAYRSFMESATHSFMLGPPFSGCAQICFALGEHLIERSGLREEKVAYVFEIGDRQHEISNTFSEYEKHNSGFKDRRSLTFLPKKTTLLQPADLIAGKIHDVLGRAREAVGFLDNGASLTPVQEFSRYYKEDGTSAALLEDPGNRVAAYVGNNALWSITDHNYADLFAQSPELLRRATKTRVPGKRTPKDMDYVP